SIKEQIKKIKSGQFNEAFLGEAERWQRIIHDSELEISDHFQKYLLPKPLEVGNLKIEVLPEFLALKKEVEAVQKVAIKTMPKEKETEAKSATSTVEINPADEKPGIKEEIAPVKKSKPKIVARKKPQKPKTKKSKKKKKRKTSKRKKTKKESKKTKKSA
ncbi:MAG: hypothetical protein ACXQS8_02110, partial [Candidatus Helarchaeales archaeon]